MRRAAVVGAGAVLALWAVAVGSAEPRTRAGARAGEPAAPGGNPPAPGGNPPMPDLLGLGLWRVFTTLTPRTRLDVHDVGGDDRRVLWPPNWHVCTQHPPPGTARDPRGRVVVGVAKHGETCPPRVATSRR
ncbi:hypothetical protein ABZ135_07100 [Streptomyces sp. NPDC006339]|uniref:hypothetical protein n=1 Tax=Streptomyces sp. NPDC006339 TaxID=3156755 RepID=UPI0033A9793E